MESYRSKVYAMISFLIITQSVSSSFGLKCYYCQIRPSPFRRTNKIPDKLCSKFNESKFFEIECPMSTFCHSRTFRLQLLHEKNVTITTRGCALQTFSYQYYNGKKWMWHHEMVPSTYKDGCSNAEYGAQIKAGKEQYCYCSTDLCNGYLTNNSAPHSDIISLIFVYNVIKYMTRI